MNPPEEKLETHFILRLPPKYAAKVKKYLQTKPKKIKKNLTIKLDPDTREGEVTVKNRTIPMKLVDLPTIVESMKTTNSKLFFKTADISQVLMPVQSKKKNNSKTVGVKTKKDEKKFEWPHGLTPPLKNVRRCRFRKILMNPNQLDSTDISKELKWLLQMDTEAVDVRWELVDDPKYKIKNDTKCHANYMNELLFGEIISDSDDDDDSAVISIHTSQDTKTEDSLESQ